MTRIRSGLLLVLFLVSACEYLNSPFTGHWINQKESAEHFYFNRDGSFTATSGVQKISGVWSPFKENHVTLSYGDEENADIRNAIYHPQSDQIHIRVSGDDLILVRADR
jgi:hypothetical protein